jgi:hypothetical protein
MYQSGGMRVEPAAEAMDAKGQRPVFRRAVFYIPGYDPFPPRRYRELYRKEGAAQAGILGYQLEIAAKEKTGAYGWRASTQIDGQRSEAEIEVLVWSDIVRGSMDQGILATYVQLIRTAWVYISSGALFAALYPIVFLLVQALIAALAGWLIGAFVAGQSHWALGLLAGGAVFWGVLRGFRSIDHRVFAYYLMHDYAFTAALRGANPAALEQRMSEFRSRIEAALGSDIDEVLVVGHSSGAHLAVSILADLIREGMPARHPPLGFLSLGQVVPMVSFLPEARRLRADLAYLSVQPDLTWLDVTAPGDGCAFALCDPVSVSGVAPSGKRWPLVISAAFSQTLSPERWRALRWRFFRLHFQYLCAFDQPADYDYFQITAGPQTLAERYRGRAPSKSRIERPENRYRSLS